MAANKEIKLQKKTFISPYAGAFVYLSNTHEKTEKVILKDGNVLGTQAMIGFSAKISIARIRTEYNFSNTSTFSYKLVVGF